LIKNAVTNVRGRGEDIDIKEYINRILLLLKGFPVSLEVIGTSSEDMISEGIKLYDMFNPVAKNVYVKIPVNPSLEEGSGENFEGIKAIKELSGRGIPVNCTLIFTPEQALLAAKSGARFVSPFVGRIDDYIRKNNDIEFEKTDYFPWDGMIRDDEILEDNGVISGVDLVAQIVEIFRIYEIKDTQVLAASIRNARQVREVALAGADIATLPFNVIKELPGHFKTREGMKLFTEDVVPEYRDLLGD
jgi:transaldolase